MNQPNCRKTPLLTLLALLALPAAVLAQTNLETNAWIQFNFLAPGAGNLGLGGAFLAIADDATTAYTNPAGLTNIVKSEIHLEARHWGYTHIFTNGGRLEGQEPTYCKDLNVTGVCPDVVRGIQDGEAEDRVTGLSFLSFVIPKKRWAIALYKHELVNFEAQFNTQGAYLLATRSRSPLGGFPSLHDGRLASLKNTMNLTIVNHSVSAALRAHKNFSIGFTLSYHEYSLYSRSERYLPRLFEAPSFATDLASSYQTQIGDDHSTSATVGFSWKSAHQNWSVAGVYRQGPSFDLIATNQATESADFQFEAQSTSAKFHVPDVLALGFALQATDAIRVALDFDYVEYSDMMKDFVDIFGVQEVFGSNPDLDGSGPELDGYTIDDVTEVHLGMEYFLYQMKNPIMLRFGTWYDPDHSLRFEGDNPGLEAVFRRQEDQFHLTAGMGISLRRLQVDAAFDYSKRSSIVSLSTAIRF